MGFRLFCLLLITLLAACGTARQEVDKAAIRDIRRVAILSVEEPESYQVREGSGATSGIFGIIAARMADARATALKSALARQGFQFGDEIVAALEAALRERGYDTVRLPIQRAKKGSLLSDYGGLTTDAGAVLDFSLFEVAFAHYLFNRIQPEISFGARLVRWSDKRELYSVHASYSPATGSEIKPAKVDERIRFLTPDHLLPAARDVAIVLRASVEPISRFVVEGLQ
jgi:hypothetical protein